MRLNCRYQDPDNTIADLDVELFTKDGWIPLGLSETSPGFLIFTYSVFTCQHMYMRLNCAERGLMLESSTGSIELVTSEDWKMQKLHVEFDGKLKSGSPTGDDIDYITGRMGQCPVSVNMQHPPESKAELRLS